MSYNSIIFYLYYLASSYYNIYIFSNLKAYLKLSFQANIYLCRDHRIRICNSEFLLGGNRLYWKIPYIYNNIHILYISKIILKGCLDYHRPLETKTIDMFILQYLQSFHLLIWLVCKYSNNRLLNFFNFWSIFTLISIKVSIISKL